MLVLGLSEPHSELKPGQARESHPLLLGCAQLPQDLNLVTSGFCNTNRIFYQNGCVRIRAETMNEANDKEN